MKAVPPIPFLDGHDKTARGVIKYETMDDG